MPGLNWCQLINFWCHLINIWGHVLLTTFFLPPSYLSYPSSVLIFLLLLRSKDPAHRHLHHDNMYKGYNLLCGTGTPPGTAISTSAIASKLGREGLGTEIFFKTISKSKSSSSLSPSSPATPRCQMEIVKAGFSNDQIQNCINQGFREAFLLN